MKKVIAIILVLFTFSCSHVEKSPEPENLFDHEKMAAIITDLYIVEGAISSNRKSYIEKGVQPSSYLYEKYAMDSISFEENLNYYTDRVKEYVVIIEKVQGNLKVLQDSVSARQERFNEEQKNLIPKNTLKEEEKSIKNKNKEEEL